jgi:hypothetical protein
MAIRLVDSTFYDVYGNTSKEFKANAGDTITAKHIFEVEISCVSSVQNQLTIDKLENKLSRGQGSFLNDGFRKGQFCSLILVNNINNITELYRPMEILAVSDLQMTITELPNRNNWTTGTDYTAVLICDDAVYDTVNTAFNFVDNDLPKDASLSLESLIDQETSKFIVDGISAFSVGDFLTMTQIGKKSGQFTASATIQRIANLVNPYTAFTSIRRRYEVSITMIFPAMFDSNSFIGDRCLKYFSRTSFRINSNDNLAPTIFDYKEKATTGLWDEAYNTDKPNVISHSTTSNLYYNEQNNITLTFTTPTSKNIDKVELGAMYLTVDDDFNKNKALSQESYLPTLKTGLINSLDIGYIFPSSTSYNFSVHILDYNKVDASGVRTHTLILSIDPDYTNANGFGKFIENRGELDRTFLLWLKIDNTNALFFDGQLEFKEAIGSPIEDVVHKIINHDNNRDYKDITINNNLSDNDFNLEDDFAYIAEFYLSSDDVNESVTAKVIAKNNATEYEFVLDKVSFDLVNINLQYFKNQYTNVNNNLPDSSNKKEAFLIEKIPLSSTLMRVRLFYPVLIDWKYWEDILSTHPYFESQGKDNKNWYNYITGDWEVKVKLEVKRNGVVDFANYTRPFKTYDDWLGTSTIELFDETETTQYTSLQENKKMLIKATHVFPTPYAGYPWGMITIEPKENSPRYIMSTEIDKTQVDNPLIGVSNEKRCDIQFPDPVTIVLRSYVNTNLLNGNDFCITSKISEEGELNNMPIEVKITEAGEDKLIETGTETKITD